MEQLNRSDSLRLHHFPNYPIAQRLNVISASDLFFRKFQFQAQRVSETVGKVGQSR
jgi:hypothetical protein